MLAVISLHVIIVIIIYYFYFYYYYIIIIFSGLRYFIPGAFRNYE